MRLVKQKCLFLLGMALQLYFFSAGGALAQGSVADTAFLERSVKHAMAAYEGAVGVETHLYNGTEYVDYKKPHLKGDQFLISKSVARGNVFYDGTWYTQVPMLYDLVTDEVVVPHNSSGLMMKLISGKVDTFQLHGHTFVRHKAGSTGQAMLGPGFYDLLYNHNVQMLVKRGKTIQDRATSTGMEGEFRVSDKFYIQKDGSYHPVSSKGSVLRVFKDKKRQLQKFASSQKLKFRKEKEAAILAMVQYYDSLSAEQQGQNSGN